MDYFASAITRHRVRLGTPPFAAGVYDEPRCLNQVGVAFLTGRTAVGLPEWSLEVCGFAVPGKFVLLGGSFDPVETVSIRPLAPSRAEVAIEDPRQS